MLTSFEIEFIWENFFEIVDNQIRQKEHSEIEYKETFHNPKSKDKKLHKWIASFANSKGGLIIYGINNKGEIVGLKDDNLRRFDNKDLTQELLNFFAPEIRFELFIKEINRIELGFLYVHEAKQKPIVTIKTAENTLQEGDIFYRYPGQSRKISYADLNNILHENYEKLNLQWMKTIQNIATIGVENVGLLNIANGELIGSHNKLLISDELLSKVTFINEGEFVEKDGAPTLKLIGDVQPIDSSKIIQVVEPRFQIITHFELYNAFFERKLSKEAALEFFRKVLHENTSYYPIYYYLIRSELSQAQVDELIAKERGQKCSEVAERIKKEKGSFCRFVKGNINTNTDSAKKILSAYKKLKNKEDFQIKKIESIELRYILQAITHLKYGEIGIDYILTILKNIYDHHFNSSSVTRTFIRQSICHVDLVIYGKQYFENIY